MKESSRAAARETARRVHRSALRLLRVLRTAEGLGTAGLGVLGRLRRTGASTASELAAYLRVQPQSLTRLLDALQRQALISSRPCAEDRRRKLLELTDAGRRMLDESMRERGEALARAISAVLTPAEQEQLRVSVGLMDRLAAALEERRDG